MDYVLHIPVIQANIHLLVSGYQGVTKTISALMIRPKKNGYKNVVYLHNGVLVSHQKQCIHEILRQMDGAGEHHTK